MKIWAVVRNYAISAISENQITKAQRFCFAIIPTCLEVFTAAHSKEVSYKHQLVEGNLEGGGRRALNHSLYESEWDRFLGLGRRVIVSISFELSL